MKKIFKITLTTIQVTAFLLTSVLPTQVFAQTESVAPLPPRAENIDVSATNIADALQDVNIGTELVRGGQDAIQECLDQPLGEFSGVLSSNVSALSAEFLGAAGLIDKAGNIAASASNIITAAAGIYSIGASFFPGSPGPDAVLDTGVLTTITSTTNTLKNLQSKVGSINARGLGSINEVLNQMQVSDNCLDRAVYIQGQQMLFELREEAVDWIVSGFEGDNPGFVQDLDQRERDLAAAEWLRFLDPDNDEFRNVCSSFRYDVVFNLRQAYNRSFGGDPTQVVPEVDISATEEYLLRQAVTDDVGDDCALNQITGSNEGTEAFLNGEFILGGWDGWLTLFNDPGSNPNLASRDATARLNRNINENIADDQQKLAWSGGYLSDEVCADGSSAGIAGICADGSNPIIVTPGAAVAEVVEQLIASDFRRRELADEIGEVVESVGMSLVGKLFPSGGSSQAPGLARISQASFADAYANASQLSASFAGTNPDAFSLAALNRQTNIEEGMYKVFSDIWKLRNSAGFEDVEQCLAGDAELEGSVAELDTLIKSLIPGSQESLEGKDAYEPPGRYKVDWAGNDFDWETDRIYGETGCGEGTYGQSQTPSDRSFIFTRFSEGPRFAFQVPRDSDNWRVSLCVPTDDGGPTFLVELKDFKPPVYRPANNRIKVDWNGQPFDWEYYDPFEKTNAYGIGSCTTATENQFAYSVGASLADENPAYSDSRAYGSDIRGDVGGGQGASSWCAFLRDLTGLGEADSGCYDSSSTNSPESRSEIITGINRAINYLLGVDLNKIQNRSESSQIAWFKNRCTIREEGGEVEGNDLGRVLQDYYIDEGVLSPAYSNQPRPTSLDVLLANISVTLDGLPDLVAPRSIIDEVLDDIDDRDAVAEGLLDLQERADDGEVMSLIASAYYELAQNRNFHDNEDLSLAQDGFKRVKSLYQLILEQSEDCQTTPGGGVGDVLADGSLQVDGTRPRGGQLELPNDYERPVTISWETQYCQLPVYVYKNGSLFAQGVTGNELDDTLVGQDTTAIYELWCGPKPNSTSTNSQQSRWFGLIPTANAQTSSSKALDIIVIDASTTPGTTPRPGTIPESTGVLTVNARSQSFSTRSTNSLRLAWQTRECPTDINIYRDDATLFTGTENGDYFDAGVAGVEGTYTYSLYCGRRPATSEQSSDTYKELDSLSVTIVVDDDENGGEGSNENGGGNSGGGNEGGGSGNGNEGGNGTDDDNDSCVDDSATDPDGDCNDNGLYDEPEPNTDANGDGIVDDRDGLDNDNDGCIDDSYLDPDGDCDNGGDYTRGEDEANNIAIVDEDNNAEFDPNDIDLPITDLSELGNTPDEDDEDSGWLWWLLLLLLILILIYLIYRYIKRRKQKTAAKQASAIRNQVSNSATNTVPQPPVQ